MLSYDMRQGFIQCGRKMPGLIGLTLLSCVDLYLQKLGYCSRGGMESLRGTWMDYLLFLLGGRSYFNPAEEQVFLLPVRWLLFHLYLLYAVLYYPCRDLQYSVGEQLLLKGGSRKGWWIAKCIWNMVFIIISYILVFVTNIVFCAVMGERTGMCVTPELVCELFDTGTSYEEFTSGMALYVLLLPCMISMTAALFEMLLSFLIKPVFSFLFLAVIYVSSAYLPTVLLVGNYAMPYRSEAVLAEGFSFGQGIVTGILIIAVCVVAGTYFFKRCDLIRRSEL